MENWNLTGEDEIASSK